MNEVLLCLFVSQYLGDELDSLMLFSLALCPAL